MGSPGLGRKISRAEHYDAVVGQKIAVKLFRPDASGRREFSGVLQSREGSTVTVLCDGQAVSFETSAASRVKLCDDEDLFG